LPHTGAQSLSVVALQPVVGQQPSPFTHRVCVPVSMHSARHVPPLESARSVQATCGQLVGQLPSQSSPASTTPLPHTGAQLLSLSELQLLGQQLSSLTHIVCVPELWHTAAQVPALARVRKVHRSCGHDIGHVESGSHVSPLSTTPLPHEAGQSTSRLAADVLHPGGQQPSDVVPLHPSCVVEHRALHVAGAPVYVLTSQHCPAVHAVGHEDGGSQVSPASVSMTPSPHPAQSESLPAVQPIGQHRSLPAVEHVLLLCAQTTLHVAALPVCVSFVQSFWSSQTGHEPGGSHVSPASMRPLPQPGQSPSFIAVHPAGQHPSPVIQALTGPASTH